MLCVSAPLLLDACALAAPAWRQHAELSGLRHSLGVCPAVSIPEILNLAGMPTHGISYKFRQMAALYHGLGGGRHT